MVIDVHSGDDVGKDQDDSMLIDKDTETEKSVSAPRLAKRG